MKKTLLLFIFLVFGIIQSGFSQCTNTSLYPSGTVTIPNDGSTTTISTCNYTSEYSNLSGAVNGNTYAFNCTLSGTHKYVTITDASNTVLDHGMSPFTWTSTVTGDIRAHWSNDGACGSTSSCHVTTVQLVCTNTSLYPSGTVAIANDGSVTSISTCNYTSEYSNLSSAVSGNDYEFSCTLSGTHKYVTITDPSDNVIASGMSPFTWTSTITGDIRAHWTDDVTCGSTSSCHVTTVQCTSCSPAITNDACAGAIPISEISNQSGSTATASNIEALTACSGGGGNGANPDCNGGTGTINFGSGVWYKYTSGGTETITASTDNSGTDFDTELQVFVGSCGSLVCVGGDDDGGTSTTSAFCWNSTASFAPVDYYIYVDGHNTASGNYELSISLGVPLPVTLTSFKGEAMDRTNMLKWETSSEENTQTHIIQRSADGVSDWEEIGRIDAVGNSTISNQYDLEDTKPLDFGYYRLMSLDFDGYFDYSEIISIKRDVKNDVVHIFPNPVVKNLTVEIGVGVSSDYEISIVNMMGQIVGYEKYEFNEGNQRIELDVDHLANGIYHLVVENKTGKQIQKFVKQ